MRWLEWLLLILLILGITPLAGCAVKGGFTVGAPPTVIVDVTYECEAFVGDSASDTLRANIVAKLPFVGLLLETLDVLGLFGKPDGPNDP